MLKKLILENWKSFRYAELYFDPLTVLIGTNASGKSNVVEALEFLRRMATGETVDVALNGDRALPPIRGGLDWVAFKYANPSEVTLKIFISKDNIETDCSYSIKINPQIKSHKIIEESVEEKCQNVIFNEIIKIIENNYPSFSNVNKSLDEQLLKKINRTDFEKFRHSCLEENIEENIINEIINERWKNDRDLQNKYEYDQLSIHDRNDLDNELNLKLSLEFAERMKNFYLSELALPFIKKSLIDIFIINPIPSQMRDFSRLSETIEQDMSNIAGVLAALPEDQKLEVESTLSYYIQHFPEGDIKKVWAEKVGRLGIDAMLYCQEEWQPGQITEIDARSMSDGTLRFIGILTALLTQPEGSLIVIEEIDNGLHPSRAELLVKTLREIGSKRKIDLLITTHNPALLDALGPEIVPFVVVAHRDSETGESKLTQLEDIENLPKLLASGTLGKLATKGSIEKSLAESV